MIQMQVLSGGEVVRRLSLKDPVVKCCRGKDRILEIVERTRGFGHEIFEYPPSEPVICYLLCT